VAEQRLRGSYDEAMVISYSLGSVNIGGGTTNQRIKPPPGARFGAIEDMHVSVTTTFTQVTTPAFIRVGTVDDADKYAELNMGAAAANTGYGLTDHDALGIKQKVIDLGKDSDAGTAITDLRIALIAPTGGSPAGVGIPTITMKWW